MRNRLALATSYLMRRARVRGKPLTLTIGSTTKCNLFCPMCMRQRLHFPPQNMEISLFRKIIDDGRDFLEFVVPYGIGEPLLNPEIYDMISYCTRNGIPTGISTNGTVLSEKASRRLIEAGLEYIIFAFDGATRETYETYRKGASFEKVRNNILKFLQIKKEMQSRIFCIVQMVALKENIKEAKALIQMWNVEGIDDIRIKKDEVHNEGCAIEGSTLPRPSPRRPCYLLWRGPMYIHYDGTVLPCCYIYPEPVIGNIKTESLDEIWNSEKMVRLREAHIHGDLRDYKTCQNCPAARPHLPVALGSFLINTPRVLKAVPFFERMARIHNISVFETLK
jgi:radical SAM protein with 4Fe4S-binding SPASM domain